MEDTFICMRTIRFLQKFGFEHAGTAFSRFFNIRNHDSCNANSLHLTFKLLKGLY